MSTQRITLRNSDVFLDDGINPPREWLIARQHLLNRAQELKRVRDQLTVERCALKWAELDEKSLCDSPGDTVMQAELLNGRGRWFPNCPGFHLLGLVGVPLIVAVFLLLQLHNLPNSSLSYSLLNAIISVLFNFTSSALLKAFSFLISLVGLSRWFSSSVR
jgi:Bacterial protein of unknown function (DUF899)